MKRLFLAGAALGALTLGAQAADVGTTIFSPKPSTQMVSGDLSLYGGFVRARYDDDQKGGSAGNGSLIGGLARANIWIAPGMSVQLDLFGEGITGDGLSDGVVDLAAHLSWRNPGQLLGVFGSLGQRFGERTGTIGLEGQTYFGVFQLYGQIGFSSVLGEDPASLYIHGEARYFINPNLLLAGNVGFGTYNADGWWGDGTVVRWGLDLETKFTPVFGAFLSYQGHHTDADAGDLTAHALLAGVKVHFNNNTLQSQAQAGATLKDYNPFSGVNYNRGW